jgi:hypothetical protein
MNYLNASCRGLLGGHPACVDFGEFKTEIILPRYGRTEANQLIYFTREEVGCIKDVELADRHSVVVPLPECCIWDEVWLSIFGCSTRHIPAFTASLIYGREQIEGQSGWVQTLEQSYLDIQTSLLTASERSLHDEQAYRAKAMARTRAEIDDCLIWLSNNRHIDLRGWTLRLSEDGIEISNRLSPAHYACHETEFGASCVVDDVIRAMGDYRPSLEQHLFYFYAHREHPSDYSFSEKLQTYQLAEM